MSPEYADSREQVHALIQDSISRNLASKGLSRVPSGGDVIVAYLVIIGNNASTEAISTYFGYDRDAAAGGHFTQAFAREITADGILDQRMDLCPAIGILRTHTGGLSNKVECRGMNWAGVHFGGGGTATSDQQHGQIERDE
jgi:hypothetical protein